MRLLIIWFQMGYKKDFTLYAVKRQLAAFGCNDFELGVYNDSKRHIKDENPMFINYWAANSIIDKVPWLKHKNSNDHDIFIRPAMESNKNLLFVDDLDYGRIQRMQNDGFVFALLIESSPQNFHGWVRADIGQFNAEIATSCCKVIAEEYKTDINSADFRHFGRLAGFTNRKPKYVNELGQQPFVKISSIDDKVSPVSAALLNKGLARIERKKKEDSARIERYKESIKLCLNGGNPDYSLDDAERFYLFHFNKFADLYKSNLDASVIDWRVGHKMIDKGFSFQHIFDAMLKHSLAAKKRGNRGMKYIELTMNEIIGAYS